MKIEKTSDLFMTIHIGHGTVDDVPFTIVVGLDGAPMVRFADASERQYRLSVQEFVMAARELDKQEQAQAAKVAP